ncbi:hypothetical protein VTN31DRAFT_1368 [Thermomyces dupontii]|uniref:uncharacterized protein n=1 Tax=Talaromyces thermophilus TaxID=28565 RepID=UPI00374250C2
MTPMLSPTLRSLLRTVAVVGTRLFTSSIRCKYYMPFMSYSTESMTGGRGHNRNNFSCVVVLHLVSSLPSVSCPFLFADLCLADTERVYDRVTVHAFYRWHLYNLTPSWFVQCPASGVHALPTIRCGCVKSVNVLSDAAVAVFLPQPEQDSCRPV